MVDLVLYSSHHQRYQHGIPVMGVQYCNRMIKIENKFFKDLFNDSTVTPEKGFLVTMWNIDTPTPVSQMQPKLMEMVEDTGDKILLRGVTVKMRGVVAYDNKDYGITLHLENRKVVKCVLHMYDRNTDIEYEGIP